MVVFFMPNYIELLRLYEAGLSLRQITNLVASERNTVTRTIKIATEKEVMKLPYTFFVFLILIFTISIKLSGSSLIKLHHSFFWSSS